MMTNKQHDDLWMAGAESLQTIPSIAKSLRVHNLLMVLKELHDLGMMSDDEYANGIRKALKKEGFEITLSTEID